MPAEELRTEPAASKPYPSRHAMEAAVRIELMVACGGYATVAYGHAIQGAIDKAIEDSCKVYDPD